MKVWIIVCFCFAISWSVCLIFFINLQIFFATVKILYIVAFFHYDVYYIYQFHIFHILFPVFCIQFLHHSIHIHIYILDLFLDHIYHLNLCYNHYLIGFLYIFHNYIVVRIVYYLLFYLNLYNLNRNINRIFWYSFTSFSIIWS